jgi:hypothetical protein
MMRWKRFKDGSPGIPQPIYTQHVSQSVYSTMPKCVVTINISKTWYLQRIIKDSLRVCWITLKTMGRTVVAVA